MIHDEKRKKRFLSIFVFCSETGKSQLHVRYFPFVDTRTTSSLRLVRFVEQKISMIDFQFDSFVCLSVDLSVSSMLTRSFLSFLFFLPFVVEEEFSLRSFDYSACFFSSKEQIQWEKKIRWFRLNAKPKEKNKATSRAFALEIKEKSRALSLVPSFIYLRRCACVCSIF